MPQALFTPSHEILSGLFLTTAYHSVGDWQLTRVGCVKRNWEVWYRSVAVEGGEEGGNCVNVMATKQEIEVISLWFLWCQDQKKNI